MIAIIRIRGKVKIKKDIEETFNRLKLKRKFSCVVFSEPTPEQLGMLKKIRDLVAYGEISKGTYDELMKARGKKTKTFFRLHPPRGGINTKEHFPKGVLGNHKEKINELVKRML
nr:50S ribosomal protein L30 [uncultured archaeon]